MFRCSSSPTRMYRRLARFSSSSQPLLLWRRSAGSPPCVAVQSPRLRCLTTSAPLEAPHPIQPPVKLGLGGQNFSRLEPQRYQKIIQTALEASIDVLEAGQEEGDAVLAKILADMPNLPDKTLTVTARLGYRTLSHDQPDVDALRELGDVTVETQSDATSINEDEDDPKIAMEVVHNISKGFVQKVVEQSELVRWKRQLNNSNVKLVYMLHNPEVHTDAERPDVLLDKLIDSFCGLEEAVADGHIDSFGVVSNGLSLPPDHPLHLPWRTVVLEAAEKAAQHVHSSRTQTSGTAPVVSNLSTLQLPMNVLETNGLQVAKDIQQYLQSSPDDVNKSPLLPNQMNVYAMRPLTCYLDQGAGSGSPPLRMIDYPIPMGDNIKYTNEMEGPPPTYQKALNEALSHFDGTALLQAKQERELTVEEKETLEGCRLLQSIIHDLDVGLEKVNSFAEHEDELVSKVIPIIYGHFEEFDEESSDVLQHFFHAHGLAVRHAISKHMRELLSKGTDSVAAYDVPQDMKLQEFALDFLLKEESVTKVIVGCSHPIQVLEHVEAARALLHGASQT